MIEVCSFISQNEQQTADFAKKMASVAQKGDVIALFGTLGMGKSVFSRAYIQYFLGNIDIPSPTFTLLQTYETASFEIHHYDLYRIKEADEIFELGMEDAFYQNVCLIEWPEKMGGYLPRKAIRIEITQEQEGRRISVFVNDEERQNRYCCLKG